MPEKISALDYLAAPQKYPARPVCAVFGNESFLRRQVILGLRATVLGGDEGDFSLRTFAGRDIELRDVLDELSMVAMFGGHRLVVVEGADDFVTRYREKLEHYVAAPSRSGVLVLELDSLPSNTRLYKAAAAAGLAVDCGAPPAARLTKWLVDWAKQQHRAQLSHAAAETLAEMVGSELGLLDQELAKLALVAGEGRKITPEMVGQSAGGWRTRTTWEMLDAMLDGKVADAMRQLDRLLASGEQPVGLLAQISASMRRFATATRLIRQAEAAGRRMAIRDALAQAGVKAFVLQRAEQQLRRLGRQRGSRLHGWLLDADQQLKGDSAMPPRLILEQLVVRLAVVGERGDGRRARST
jgi:DNA polymerase-3 subunit delta